MIAASVVAALLAGAGSASAAGSAPSAPSGSGSAVSLVLDGKSLTWSQIGAVLAADTVDVRLGPGARRAMATTRDRALTALRGSAHVYGWNRGLGPLKDQPLSPADQRQFQVNVLHSHAAGTGSLLPPPVVRLGLILRANSMARATMGVRPELVDRMLGMVDAGITPDVPSIGSLGTGDLQPMAAAGLSMTGLDNPVTVGGRRMAAPAAFTAAGLAPSFPLESGEALQLVSGSSMLTARYAASVRRAEDEVATFEGTFALFLEATRAELGQFDARTHAERGLAQEVDTAADVREMVCGTGWATAQGRARLGETKDRVQDSTAVRAMPQVVGQLRETLDDAHDKIVREVNGSTSNPLIFQGSDGTDFLSGGNWSASEIGHAIDSLNSGMVDMAVLSEDLSGRLIDPKWSYGLPPNLAGGRPGLNTGMVPLESTASALLPEMQIRANPASVLSRSLKGGQEDHNTMAMAAERDLDANLDREGTVLAVGLLTGAQAIDLIAPKMKGLANGPGTAAVHGALRKVVAPLGEDRHQTPDLQAAEGLVRSGGVARAVGAVTADPTSRCAA